MPGGLSAMSGLSALPTAMRERRTAATSAWLAAMALWCLLWTCDAQAWGAAGHETVGEIADQLIAGTPAALRVRVILGMDLRTASVWADCVKGVTRDVTARDVSAQDGGFRYEVNARYRECRPFEDAAGRARMVDYVARNWDRCHPAAGADPCHKQYHYTDVAIERDGYARRDVGTSDHDVVAALGASIRVLQGRPAPAPFSIKDQREALLLLVHLVGDLHQPLHVGAVYLDPAGHAVDPDRGGFDPDTSTRGGNQLLDDRRVLHREWDDIPTSLQPAHLGIAGAADARAVSVTVGALSAWPALWAGDTVRVSHEAFRGLVVGAEDVERHSWPVTLPADYAERRETLQRRQLVLAGARLAQVVERVFP